MIRRTDVRRIRKGSQQMDLLVIVVGRWWRREQGYDRSVGEDGRELWERVVSLREATVERAAKLVERLWSG